MRKLLLAASAAFALVSCDTLKLPTGGEYGTVTESDAAEGIRQALSQGITTAIFNLNKEDAFFGNQA